MAATHAPDLVSGTYPRSNRTASLIRKNGSIWAWTILLLIVNLPLAWGEIRSSMLFLPEAVNRGEWWRVFTFPLVHLSWYHFLLDAGGFLLLFGCLEEKRWFPRSLYILGSGAGALSLALALEPAIATQGLSGLSGIAHGLMAIAALEMLRHGDQRRWGWISLAAVVCKSAYELWSGHVLFEFIHMGMCGQPLAACHAGGVLGALIAYTLVHARPGGPASRPRAIPGEIKGSNPQGTAIQSFMGVAMQILARIIYRVRYQGLEHIPARGAAVLVCNHVTYVDWMIITGACRRPVHFVMHASIYRIPILNRILRMAKAIPIESGSKNPVALRQALEEIARVLRNGGLVCIFPEGRLTRTGRIDRFRPGVERIIRQTPVPVVPLALRGMWGSFFSHKNGPAMRCRPRKTGSPVELVVGREVSPGMATAGRLRCAVQSLHGDVS